ncbi:hypothetical protein WA577_006150, partial [Blastocystis sp. JDR]
LPSLKSLLFGRNAFKYCSRAAFENLPALTSIQLGFDAFYFKNDESSELIMRNLPKLPSLTAFIGSWTFKNPHVITLEDMPSLTNVILFGAFELRYEVHIN